ncbi:hypothetical protein SAMN04487974_102135 [Pelagibacterium luteolum]|uniref:Uncharacterized protein n=2 Tax=Pelagibacterium luteolum TaxID=440168 RepID=A0A1G7THT2_9HYPH|nr:hypothetical protein SAMN04487974_102135 [Pelagibacterium luteolum]
MGAATLETRMLQREVHARPASIIHTQESVMFWWIIASLYLIIAIVTFIGLVRWLVPIDVRAWLTVLMAALFWPIYGVMWALG